ncbi:hypothetical protein TNCV_1276501 [Trichonephila clavipes]|nr:hypothetical protein TNCV_1276501 [Trichonephila clavipes]
MHQITCESSPRLERGGPLTKTFHLTCPACHLTCPACHWTPVLKLFLGDLCFIGPVQHFLCGRPLSQSSLWGGMKHFLSALKNVLVGNLKNFVLFIHDCSPAYFASYMDRDPKQRWGIKTGESRQESYKKSPLNVPLGWKSEKQVLDKK